MLWKCLTSLNVSWVETRLVHSDLLCVIFIFIFHSSSFIVSPCLLLLLSLCCSRHGHSCITLINNHSKCLVQKMIAKVESRMHTHYLNAMIKLSIQKEIKRWFTSIIALRIFDQFLTVRSRTTKRNAKSVEIFWFWTVSRCNDQNSLTVKLN